MNHINNAIAFTLVEEVLARRRDLRAPLRVEVEYRSSIDRDIALRIGGVDAAAQHDGWLVDDQTRCQIAFKSRAHLRLTSNVMPDVWAMAATPCPRPSSAIARPIGRPSHRSPVPRSPVPPSPVPAPRESSVT